MSHVTKLCNPTPIDAEIHYEAGKVLKVPAFEEIPLTLQQMDDYRPDKPGSEDALEDLIPWGVFLKDDDRTYEDQALEALNKAIEQKELRFKEGVTNMQRLESRRPGGGNTEEEAVVEFLEFGPLQKEIEIFKSIQSQYKQEVEATGGRRIREQIDPNLAVFFANNKPKVFPTKSARDWYLSQATDEIVAEHEEYMSKLKVESEDASNQ